MEKKFLGKQLIDHKFSYCMEILRKYTSYKTVLLRDRKRCTASKSFEIFCPNFGPIFCQTYLSTFWAPPPPQFRGGTPGGAPPSSGLGGTPGVPPTLTQTLTWGVAPRGSPSSGGTPWGAPSSGGTPGCPRPVQDWGVPPGCPSDLDPDLDLGVHWGYLPVQGGTPRTPPLVQDWGPPDLDPDLDLEAPGP